MKPPVALICFHFEYLTLQRAITVAAQVSKIVLKTHPGSSWHGIYSYSMEIVSRFTWLNQLVQIEFISFDQHFIRFYLLELRRRKWRAISEKLFCIPRLMYQLLQIRSACNCKIRESDWFSGDRVPFKGPGKRGHIVLDTLLPMMLHIQYLRSSLFYDYYTEQINHIQTSAMTITTSTERKKQKLPFKLKLTFCSYSLEGTRRINPPLHLADFISSRPSQSNQRCTG